MVSSTSAATVKAVLLDGAVNDFAQLLLAAGDGDLVVEDVIGVRTVLGSHKAQILAGCCVER